MRRSALLLCLPLALAACGPQGLQTPDAYDLSGTIGGNWGTDPRLRLALVGTGFPSVVTNTSNLAQNVVSSGVNTWKFGVDLPNTPDGFGLYQIVVYNDANNNATLDAGEVQGTARNKQWLIYSTVGTEVPETTLPGGIKIPKMTVNTGWNLYDANLPLGTSNPRSGQKITGYDLSR